MIRGTFSTIVIIAIVLQQIDHCSSESVLDVTTDALKEHLEKAFSKERSFETGAEKTKTRQYISDFFMSLAENYNTEIIVQPLSFEPPRDFITCGDSDDECTGKNYMWILPGERYGTAEDKLSLIGTHYDTVYTSPGVDDNGSGMAAMLEAARILANSKYSCPLLNSVAFVAFDWEEYYLTGSGLFMSYLAETMADLNIPEESFAGAIIMDTMLNWDDTDNSQTLPPGFDIAFSDIYNKLEDRGFKGDFMTIIQRQDDLEIGQKIKDTWGTLSHPSKYREETIALPLSGRTTEWSDLERAGFGDFLRSDHRQFWDYGNTTGLKAVFLTDTANFRGNMKQCYHQECDNMDALTDEKLEFLAKITETLVRYELELSTEKPAATCAGAPQENWDPPTGNGNNLAGSSVLAVGLFAVYIILNQK